MGNGMAAVVGGSFAQTFVAGNVQQQTLSLVELKLKKKMQ